jgi:pilus assembly protein CpaB
MRAMSVKVNEVVGVAGFVVPGTKVDVIVTLRHQDDSLTRTVASDVQVLTAGTRYDQEKAKDGQPIPSTVVTLMVSPEDAERITLAQEQGQLMLALRNPLDTEKTPTNGVRTAGLFGTPTPEPAKAKAAVRHVSAAPPPAPLPAIAPKPYTVEAIRAAKRTEEVIR